jgi:choice-of-anchor B domain-containing protein
MNKILLFTLLTPLLFVNSASQSQNIVLAGQLQFGVTAAGVWHYVDSLNNEYALVGLNNRIAVVDVTVPSAPIEKFNVPALSGENSLWRELKTEGKYAYAVSEGGGGVIVIDLSQLPDTIYSQHWYGDGAINGLLTTAHTIAADNGYLYIFGSNIGVGGCLIADLTDPWNPHYVGQYNTEYVHDGYIRNDTLYAGEIYTGNFAVIDVTDKTNPVLITTQQSPAAFTHNTWLSDNGQYLYTTDEVNGAPLGAFDISDLNNITIVNAFFNDSLPNEEIHNVRVLNDFLINPSYGSQITIVDAARPHNLIEIAHAKTDNNSGQSFLCWDASPYLPSGNLIATDVAGGLLIFTPTYTRACYLEGTVYDSLSNALLNNVLVEINSTSTSVTSAINGEYKTGIINAGIYDVTFSKPGYITKTYTGVNLSNGVLTIIDALLVPFMVQGQVTSTLTGTGISNVNVSASNGTNIYTATTDGSGNYTINSIVSGIYTITAAAWGYTSECNTLMLDGTSPVNFQLSAGIMDDFSTDNLWVVASTCTTGAWTRGIPVGTVYGGSPANPGNDILTDCSDQCYMTGNGGGTSTTDDVDNGFTTLTSPVFDLTSYLNPVLNYSRWFFINPNVTPSASDTLFIYLSNGIVSVEVENATLSSPGNGTWQDKIFGINSLITPTANMTITVVASDKTGSGNIVEAAFDNFSITDASSVNEPSVQVITVSPNPFNNTLYLNIPAVASIQSGKVTLTDVTGRLCYSGTLQNNIQIPSDLSSGIYTLNITGTSIIYQPVKVIKN